MIYKTENSKKGNKTKTRQLAEIMRIASFFSQNYINIYFRLLCPTLRLMSGAVTTVTVRSPPDFPLTVNVMDFPTSSPMQPSTSGIPLTTFLPFIATIISPLIKFQI